MNAVYVSRQFAFLITQKAMYFKSTSPFSIPISIYFSLNFLASILLDRCGNLNISGCIWS